MRFIVEGAATSSLQARLLVVMCYVNLDAIVDSKNQAGIESGQIDIVDNCICICNADM